MFATSSFLNITMMWWDQLSTVSHLKRKAWDLYYSQKDNGATAKAKVEAIFDSFPIEKAPKHIRHVKDKEEVYNS